MVDDGKQQHFGVLIIGAGAGGVSVAARLCRKRPAPNVGILDPSDKHYYQPLWTLVGGGEARKESSVRPQASVIPAGATWIPQAVAECLPDEHAVVTADGRRISYDKLVVAPGIQIDWGKIGGLEQGLGRDGLCSNYSYDSVDSTWRAIREFSGGTAVFTHPGTPIKCGGAPQKIMYLAADYWRKHPPGRPYQVVFCIATPTIFGSAYYAAPLLEVAARYGIDVRFRHDLVSLDGSTKQATFKRLDTDESVELTYDLMHVTPPMSAPDFLKTSPLANEGGWVAADKETLRHPTYEDVFALGDASDLPTSKTAAAVRQQVPVLVANLQAAMSGQPPTQRYNGYTSCPLVTGYGKLILAEFGYDGQPLETFPVDQRKERLSMYLLKKHVLPRLYWNGMLKGRA